MLTSDFVRAQRVRFGGGVMSRGSAAARISSIPPAPASERRARAVRATIEAGVAYVTLTAAETGNAMSERMLDGLSAAISDATSTLSCRAIVISAEGKSFCRGLDLEAAFVDDSHPDGAFVDSAVECLSMIRNARVPVIACVEGDVTAGGIGLVAACDIVIAAPQAAFMLSEVIVGMMPALVCPFLLRRLSPARVATMALSSRRILAHEARELGLVDEVAEEGAPTALHRQLQRILRSSPDALAQTKQYVNMLASPNFEQQVRAGAAQLRAWVARPGVADGVRAFAEGDVPPWFQRHVARK